MLFQINVVLTIVILLAEFWINQNQVDSAPIRLAAAASASANMQPPSKICHQKALTEVGLFTPLHRLPLRL